MLGVPFRRVLLVALFAWIVVFLVLLVVTPHTVSQGNTSPTCTSDGVAAPQTAFPKELSFILLNWKRLECLKIIIWHAQVYHTFITEIVIGNNNPNVTIKPQDFYSPKIPVRVLNYPQNRYFYARYELCLLSKGSYCYMQDDDWDNKHLRSMYANFLRYPHLLHTDTNAFVHYLSWAWTFFDPAINLHTGFSWVGTGAITSKENVKIFVDQQAIMMDRDDLSLADMYFSTWFNQVPYQLENELTELESRFGFSSESGGIKRNKLHITKGLQLIFRGLRENSPLFTKEERRPLVEERYTKSPCFADDCLFMTSLHSFPDARKFKYEETFDLEAVEHLHGSAFAYERFVTNAYHHAVDESTDTAWISLHEIHQGDFFGLDLLEPSEKDYVYLKVRHAYQIDLSLDVSDDGDTWTNERCSWEIATKIIDSVYYHRYSVTSGCACEFRFLRFSTLQPYEFPLHVYDISFTDRSDIWGAGGEEFDIVVPRHEGTCPPVRSPSWVTAKPTNLPAFLPEIGNGELPVSLVMLNWRRTHNFPFIFQHLSKYPFVNEYIIWNNNNEMILDQRMLFPKGPPTGVSVRIINSPQNLHDYAKYLSCSIAKNDYCYFQDDDWLNVYFQSQYTSFLRFPYLFHSMTIPIIYLEHRRWNIYDEKLKLHAGFSWLGVGSFTSKERVQRFLHQCSLFSLNQNELLQADLFFSYFNNDYPIELASTASALDQSNAWSNSVDQWGIVYKRLQLSSMKVYNHLNDGNKGNTIPTSAPSPPYEARDVRSPCRNDNCLFITNSYPFPHPHMVPFDPSKTIKEQEVTYNSLDWPSNWFWEISSYERAVDENIFSAWSSYHPAKVGDYFGLDLLKYGPHPRFTVVLDHDIDMYDLTISFNAVTWSKIPYANMATITLAGPLRMYIFSVEGETFRFIQLVLKQAQGQFLSVFEFCEGTVPTPPAFGGNKVLNPSFEDEKSTNMWDVQYPAQVDFAALQQENYISYAGGKSVVFSSHGGASTYAATQTVDLDQQIPRPVVISAYSKSVDAINMEYPAAGYALVVSITYTNGDVVPSAYTYVFNEGTHGWQVKTILVKQERSLKSITVALVFRNHKGTVYFDEVSVQEAQ